MARSLSLLLLGATAHLARGQWVAAPTDLKHAVGYAGIPLRYKQVPTGICELDPSVKSFSGYADVEENQHLFFWFFESRKVDPHEAPLSVWINGGPGSSSMIGLFQELGPCGVDYSGNPFNNPYSWSEVSNMLFIDQPTQTGFSYSVPVPAYTDPDTGELVELQNKTCPPAGNGTCGTWPRPDLTLTANSTANAAPNMWKTLQGFMGVFPQYSRGEFHFATESYGGHYGPVFNEYFEEKNKALPPGATEIHLKTVLIGNGWIDPVIQYPAYYNFTVWPGNTYDFKPFTPAQAEEMFDATYGPGNCTDQLAECAATGNNTICGDADEFCYVYAEYLYDEASGRSEYDLRYLTPDPFPYSFYVDYLNRADVQAAIGAFVNFSESDTAVGEAFGNTGDDAREDGTVADLRSLLSDGVNVVLYAGDADYICNWIGVEAVAAEVGAAGWSTAGYANMSTSDGVLHAQVKQAGRFSFTRVFESGHEVPFFQPLASLELFERAINGLDIATGKVPLTKCYRTKGTPTSEFREGNKTIQWEVIPDTYTYDTETNEPGPLWPGAAKPPARRLERSTPREGRAGRRWGSFRDD